MEPRLFEWAGSNACRSATSNNSARTNGTDRRRNSSRCVCTGAIDYAVVFENLINLRLQHSCAVQVESIRSRFISAEHDTRFLIPSSVRPSVSTRAGLVERQHVASQQIGEYQRLHRKPLHIVPGRQLQCFCRRQNIHDIESSSFGPANHYSYAHSEYSMISKKCLLFQGEVTPGSCGLHVCSNLMNAHCDLIHYLFAMTLRSHLERGVRGVADQLR